MSLASSIRSAAQATFSAPRQVPIRWRLAGGSALLTLVILCGFAGAVGGLTSIRLHADFEQEVERAARVFAESVDVHGIEPDPRTGRYILSDLHPELDEFTPGTGAIIRIVTAQGVELNTTRAHARLRPAAASARARSTATASRRARCRAACRTSACSRASTSSTRGRWRPSRRPSGGCGCFSSSACSAAPGLALLAGLMVARRAMAPIAALTATARKIERTRDPGQRIPDVEADDEVAELARTLDDMLHALDASRAETEGALARQREFVADASHELRTPLTSVLANLELLADSLDGEQQDAAHSALRSSRRMRRLVADLLLLARHDAARQAPHTPTDVGQVLVEAAAELGVIADGHELSIEREPRDRRRRARRAAPPDAEPHGERDPPHAARHAGARGGRARRRQRPPDRRGRRPGHPRGPARARLRALRARRRRPRRLVGPRPVDRARRRRVARRQRDVRVADDQRRRPRRAARASRSRCRCRRRRPQRAGRRASRTSRSARPDARRHAPRCRRAARSARRVPPAHSSVVLGGPSRDRVRARADQRIDAARGVDRRLGDARPYAPPCADLAGTPGPPSRASRGPARPRRHRSAISRDRARRVVGARDARPASRATAMVLVSRVVRDRAGCRPPSATRGGSRRAAALEIAARARTRAVGASAAPDARAPRRSARACRTPSRRGVVEPQRLQRQARRLQRRGVREALVDRHASGDNPSGASASPTTAAPSGGARGRPIADRRR